MADTTQEFTPEQIEQFQAYENHLADKTHAEGSTSMYPAIGGGAGAAVGAAVGAGNVIAKGKNAAKELISAAKAPASNATPGDKWAKAIGGPGGVTQDIAVENRAMQHALTPKEAAEFKVAREGIILPKKEVDAMAKEAAAAEAAAAKLAAEKSAAEAAAAAAKAKTIPARLSAAAKTFGPAAPLIGPILALGSAGYDVGDVVDRGNKGQYGRAALSGLGALGGVAGVAAPHPIAKAIGTGVSLGAPMLNMYLDKKAQEYPEFFEKYNLAQGGTVPNLDTQKMAHEIMQHHLESKKPKHKPAFTIHTLPPGLTKEQFTHLCNGGHVEF
jgi:hypothetical protein